MPQVTCPNGHRLNVPDRNIGQLVKCPGCQTSFVASTGEEAAAAFEELGESDSVDSRPARGKKKKSEFPPIALSANVFVGRPLLCVGLFLVILGRGCDATSMRSVSRANAQYHQAQELFYLEWDAKTAVVQRKINQNNRQMNEGGDRVKLNDENREHQKELAKMREDQATEADKRTTGAWKPLQEASMTASTNHQMVIWWYECLFIFGTLVLTMGVLTLAFMGQGAEQKVAYIILTIVIFSVYVGGAAWIESIVSSAQSGHSSPAPIRAKQNFNQF